MEFVRAESPDTGHQFTISRKAAEAEGLKILDGRPAVDAVGRPLPAKPRTSKGGSTPRTSRRRATKKAAGKPALSEES